MGLFDIFNVIGSMDKNGQARECINQAKQYVREGKEIYRRAYDEVSTYASETEKELNEHAEYKKKIAKELGGDISNTLKQFNEFNIDSRTIGVPFIKGLQTSGSGSGVFNGSMSIFRPRDDVFIDWLASDYNYNEARRQRDEAMKYKEQMIMEKEKLYGYKEQMKEIRSFISVERSELDSLMDKVRKMTYDLQAGMKKRIFRRKEANYLKGTQKIIESIITLLSTEFLNDTFSVTKKYQKAFDNIKIINQHLPYAPSVSDTTTLDALKKIKKIIVMS